MKLKILNACFISSLLICSNIVLAGGNSKGRNFVPPKITFGNYSSQHVMNDMSFFENDVQISPLGDQFSPHLVCRSSGEIFAAFYTSDSTITVMNSTDGGNIWYNKFSIYWGERGASISDIGLSLSEGDSTCVFLPHIIYYSGIDVSQLIVYRLNLVTGASGFRLVKEFVSPAIPSSPQVVSDAWDSTNYRVRTVWLVQGISSDTVYYCTSLDQGWSWTESIPVYIDNNGGMANLSVAYGKGEWWMAWDKSGDIFVRSLFSGNVSNITHSPYTHYRPILAIAGKKNSGGKISMAVSFVRRWSQDDLGSYFIASDNSGLSWGPFYAIGTDLTTASEYNPYVSYSKTLDRFYYTLITQTSIGSPSQFYQISSYYATNDLPDQPLLINQQVNNDTIFGSFKANPVIMENPGKGGEPVLAWRHWSGNGDGKIMFDAQYRTMDINQNSPTFSESFRLYQNFPNPFNPTTRIKYLLNEKRHVSLIVYDVLGSAVATLVDEYKLPGTYEVQWNAADLSGGVYFCRFKADNYTAIKKIILIR